MSRKTPPPKKDSILDELLGRRTNFKIEPEEFEIKEEPIVPFEPQSNIPKAPEWDQEDICAIKEEPMEAYETTTMERNVETDYLNDRADDIRKRLAENTQAPLAININPNLETMPVASSPLGSNAYSFQGTVNNYKIVSRSTGAPHEIAQARQIGAYLNRDPRLRNNLPQTMDVNANMFREVKKTANAESQTDNDGSLYVPEQKLRNLTPKQRDILLEFKKEFNISDKESFDAIQERLKHRLANDIYYNSNSGSYGHSSKQGQTYHSQDAKRKRY